MPEVLFNLDMTNRGDLQQQFRGKEELEYYQGDCWGEQGNGLRLQSERKMVGAISIISQKGTGSSSFRRTQRHIRDDPTDVSVLWFVKRGQLAFSNQFGSKVATPGDFAITGSMSPFLIECQIDDDGVHEVLHVTLPSHILRPYFERDSGLGLFLPMDRPELIMAENIFHDVFAHDGDLAADSTVLLVDTALRLIGGALKTQGPAVNMRPSVSERRLEQLLRFIELHLSDPNLSIPMLSKACSLSPRYISTLLRPTGKSFSKMLWSQRLDNAKKWLTVGNPREISISEIAYGTGFKSPAHFSRTFKKAYGLNPRDYRDVQWALKADDDAGSKGEIDTRGMCGLAETDGRN